MKRSKEARPGRFNDYRMPVPETVGLSKLQALFGWSQLVAEGAAEASSFHMSRKAMARPKRFELLTPRFVVKHKSS